MRTPARRSRGMADSAVRAARRAALLARKLTGRARCSARPSVANELTRALPQPGSPEGEHRQRVALRRSRLFGRAAIDQPVEARDRVAREVTQVSLEPAFHRRVEALLRPPRDRRAETL